MPTDTVKLTIRLPRRNMEFAKAYAKAYAMSLTEVIDRYLKRIRILEKTELSPEMDAITGLVPRRVDASAEYRQYLQDKHQ